MRGLEIVLGFFYGFSEKTLSGFLRLFFSGRGKTNAEELVTVPNFISLLRIPLGVGVLLTAQRMPLLAAMLFGAGVMSDHLDGTLARLMGPTKSGAIIDSTCDKAFFFLCATAYRQEFAPFVFWTIAFCEVFILAAPLVALRLKKVRVSDADLRANIFGKTKFFLECCAITAAVLGFHRITNPALALAIPFACMSIYKKIKDSF